MTAPYSLRFTLLVTEFARLQDESSAEICPVGSIHPGCRANLWRRM
jgi:hypothetical protein